MRVRDRRSLIDALRSARVALRGSCCSPRCRRRSAFAASADPAAGRTRSAFPARPSARPCRRRLRPAATGRSGCSSVARHRSRRQFDPNSPFTPRAAGRARQHHRLLQSVPPDGRRSSSRSGRTASSPRASSSSTARARSASTTVRRRASTSSPTAPALPSGTARPAPRTCTRCRRRRSAICSPSTSI